MAKKVRVWLEGVQPCSLPQCPRTPPGENISPTHSLPCLLHIVTTLQKCSPLTRSFPLAWMYIGRESVCRYQGSVG
ncbi:hypothetical protein AYX13_03429 [Cryptococcus neoformans]|nr:hypothetical protein AYX13_03429 [Cryptococcus neoformans var. grubii]